MSTLEDRVLTVSVREIQDLVRYRRNWSSLNQGEEEAVISVDGAYVAELEDFLAALRRLKKKNASYHEIETEWLRPLIRSADELGLNVALGYPGTEFRYIDVSSMSEGEPLNREEALAWVMMELVMSLSNTQEVPYDALIRPLANILWNETHPAEHPRFTDGQKERYISRIFDQDRLEKLDEDELKTFRRYTEKLIKQGNLTALRIKAYSCYGGNAAYKCNWDYAREALEVLLEATQDPFAANSLGYIYYYGRGSLPGRDEAKAYRYFTVGAFNGIYESMYKSADILMKGEGVPKNYRAAARLITRVYYENLERIGNDEFDCKFADAALRMGNMYRDGTGMEQDDMEAYECYLQADLAIRQRAVFHHYGDRTVFQRIESALEEMKEKLAGGIELRSLNDFSAEYLRDLMDGYPGRLKCFTMGNTVRLEVSRISYGPYPAPKMLITVGPMSYCRISDVFIMYAQNVRDRKLPAQGEAVDFDFVDYNEAEAALDFYHWGDLIARITGDFLIQDDRYVAGLLTEDEQELCFVSGKRVVAKENGTYVPVRETIDAVCSYEPSVGDICLVDAGDEQLAMEVSRIYRAKMQDLPYARSFYKTVIRKITPEEVPVDYRFWFDEE